MSIKISYLNKSSSQPSANIVLFSDEKFNLKGLRKYLLNSEFSYIEDLLKTSDLKKAINYLNLPQKKIVLIYKKRLKD